MTPAPKTLAQAECSSSTSYEAQQSSTSSMQPALRTAFAAWVSAWRIAAEEHAAELERALSAAAQWRSRFHGRPACAAEQTQVEQASAEPAEPVEPAGPAEPAEAEPKALPAEADAPSDPDHAAELQRALEAAASWRTKLARAPATVDSLDAKLREADQETETASTASMPESLSSSESAEFVTQGKRHYCVFAAYLKDVSRLLSEGLSSGSRCLRFHAGPWGRTGVARRGEEVLVYVDVEMARAAGAKLQGCRKGMKLAPYSSIHTQCFYKMVKVHADWRSHGEVLYERQSTVAATGIQSVTKVVSSKRPARSTRKVAPKIPDTREAIPGPLGRATGSPLAAWLRSMA